MNNIETMKLALEALQFGLHVGFDESSERQIQKGGKAFDQHNQAITALRQAIEQAQQAEPVALKKGECWPESVMQMWDYYRKQIANGHTGSEPRDWFESLAEMRLVDTSPPPRQPLTDEQVEKIIKANMSLQMNLAGIRADFEAANGIKEKNT